MTKVRSILAAAVAAATFAVAAPAAAAQACPASVQAPSAIAIESSTGMVACERAADRRLAVGSAVKLMTALVTLERARLSDVYVASSYRPAPIESKIDLQPGERISVRDLLRGLLVESGNDAAMTLAEGVAGSERAFVRAMNRRARRLGLRDTRYKNPIGLDERGQHSSARDLVRLAQLLLENPFFRRTVNQPAVTVSGETFANRNDLVRELSWVNGVKTGHTRAAGYVLVGSGRRNGIQVISAVLGTPSERARDDASRRLLAWGADRFQRVRAIKRGKVLASVPIRYRRGAELDLVASRTERLVIARGERDRVRARAIRVPAEVQGPIRGGQRLGMAEIRYGGRRVATVPLVAQAAVPKADLAQRTKAWFTRPLVIVLAFAALSATLLLARVRRRGGRPGRRAGREASAA